VSDFKKLRVWQKAHALSLCVDRVCKEIRGAQYGSLRNQIFRAATSIPANIAEGRRQESEKEFARFFRYALNSSSELEYHLILAHDTKVISEADFRSLATQTIRVRKMLYVLLRFLSPPRRSSQTPMRASSTAGAEPTAGPPPAGSRTVQFPRRASMVKR
jgi:four helix bundle protein